MAKARSLSRSLSLKKSLTMKKKMFFLFGLVFVGGFAVLIGRLFILQVIDGASYAEKALAQQLTTTTISAKRGTIYDRNMKALAESATVWDVIASPSYITSEEKRNAIAEKLSTILSMDKNTVYNILCRNSSYEIIKKKVEKSTADLVEKYINDNNISGIGLIEDSQRYYPYGDFASQLLGFTGTDNQGLAGIESEYEKYLEGVDGKIVTAKNAVGTDMPYDYSDYVAAQDGNNVVSTIDEVVQYTLENALTKAVQENNVTNQATGIVMNVNTGEIIAMATAPGYDPNAPFTIADSATAASISSLTGDALKTAKAAAQQKQWTNKAISYAYEPGSVFKVVTASAGLDEGVVSLNSTFYDPGYIKVGDRTFHCWKAGGHGSITFLEGFEESCNVVFISVGQLLGANNFYKYYSAFGLTAKTGIDLPGESAGLYYTAERLGEVELASCSFGQSNTVTALQMITAVAAAANGGYLVTPHVVKEITDSTGKVIKTYDTTVKRQVISSDTSKTIDQLLLDEVNEGTGSNAYVAGYRIGGKTGTSQKQNTTDTSLRIASFVGVAPCDDPQYAIIIVLDEPHNPVSNFGGVIAAPVAAAVFSEVLPYLGVEPVYTEAELAQLSVETPNVIGKSLNDAKNAISAQGLNYKVFGTGDTVTAQVPAAGDTIPKNGTVVIYMGGTAENNVIVPALSGMTPSQVSSKLASLGLNAKLENIQKDDSGETAYEQDITSGTAVSPGTVVTVKFRNTSIVDDNVG